MTNRTNWIATRFAQPSPFDYSRKERLELLSSGLPSKEDLPLLSNEPEASEGAVVRAKAEFIFTLLAVLSTQLAPRTENERVQAAKRLDAPELISDAVVEGTASVLSIKEELDPFDMERHVNVRAWLLDESTERLIRDQLDSLTGRS